ncbi:hypothetical protein C0U40_14985 [Amylibacter cionae]|nr:hypothetical protein C0U40_14985 [Amylibacter cionae]
MHVRRTMYETSMSGRHFISQRYLFRSHALSFTLQKLTPERSKSLLARAACLPVPIETESQLPTVLHVVSAIAANVGIPPFKTGFCAATIQHQGRKAEVRCKRERDAILVSKRAFKACYPIPTNNVRL